MKRWGVVLLLSSMTAASWPQRLPSPDDPKAIVAEVQQDAKRQGVVRTGAVVWRCSGKLCIATSKRVVVGVNICQALAEQVGSLSRFGRVERPIPSYDLAMCNVRAQIKLAKIEQQHAAAEAARLRRMTPRAASAATAKTPAQASTGNRLRTERRRDPPPVIQASPIAPSYKPPIFSIRVAQLAVVGREAFQAAPLFSSATSPMPDTPASEGSATTPPPVESTASAASMPEPPDAEPSASASSDMEPTPSQSPESAPQAGPWPMEVPALGVVGHGRMRESVPGSHLTVTVIKLELVGQPADNREK